MPGGQCRTRKQPEHEYILYQTDRQTQRGVQRRANWLGETLMGQRKFQGGAIGRASPSPTRAVLWGNSSAGTPMPTVSLEVLTAQTHQRMVVPFPATSSSSRSLTRAGAEQLKNISAEKRPLSTFPTSFTYTCHSWTPSALQFKLLPSAL